VLLGKSPYELANRVQTLHADMTEEKLLSTFIPRFKSPFLSVTHDFGHLDGVLMMVYSSSQQELSPEKSDIHLFPENIFLKRVRRFLIA
jgi:ATPase subunit of ABC transporter with duplicated ATPase domains